MGIKVITTAMTFGIKEQNYRKCEKFGIQPCQIDRQMDKKKDRRNC